jgi:hypothetical protein
MSNNDNLIGVVQFFQPSNGQEFMHANAVFQQKADEILE